MSSAMIKLGDMLIPQPTALIMAHFRIGKKWETYKIWHGTDALGIRFAFFEFKEYRLRFEFCGWDSLSSVKVFYVKEDEEWNWDKMVLLSAEDGQKFYRTCCEYTIKLQKQNHNLICKNLQLETQFLQSKRPSFHNSMIKIMAPKRHLVIQQPVRVS